MVVDSCLIRAVHGGDQTGPNPTDRAKRGSKRHLICDGRGVPLAIRLTGANRNDSQEALALVDAIPPLHGERGRPRQRPHCVLGDRGSDAAAMQTRAEHTPGGYQLSGTKRFITAAKNADLMKFVEGVMNTGGEFGGGISSDGTIAFARVPAGDFPSFTNQDGGTWEIGPFQGFGGA